MSFGNMRRPGVIASQVKLAIAGDKEAALCTELNELKGSYAVYYVLLALEREGALTEQGKALLKHTTDALGK